MYHSQILRSKFWRNLRNNPLKWCFQNSWSNEKLSCWFWGIQHNKRDSLLRRKMVPFRTNKIVPLLFCLMEISFVLRMLSLRKPKASQFWKLRFLFMIRSFYSSQNRSKQTVCPERIKEHSYPFPPSYWRKIHYLSTTSFMTSLTKTRGKFLSSL